MLGAVPNIPAEALPRYAIFPALCRGCIMGFSGENALGWGDRALSQGRERGAINGRISAFCAGRSIVKLGLGFRSLVR